MAPLHAFTLPRFYFLNVISLVKTNAKERVFAAAHTARADTILIVQTWFTRKHNDADLKLDGYALFRRDRYNRKGGGLCAYVGINIPCSI
jgi:hypothetical protein